jgi:anti-anti-sigma regulatory factor
MPPLRIELATLRTIVVVTLTGDFVRPSCLELRDVIKPLIEEGFRCFVIEFDVSQMDEAGFAEVVSTYTTVTDLGGQIATKPNQLVRDMERDARLLSVFDTFSTIEEAVEWLEINCTERKV